MKTYILIIPSGQPDITLSLPYGSMNFKNGERVSESSFTKNYPDLFHLIPEINKVETIKEKVEKKAEEIKLETPKKKAGRPKKTFTKGK